MAGNGSFDAIIIGAGHNGLTAACFLAKAGMRTLVCERRDVVGGLCAPEEFVPGYRHAGLLHDTSAVRPAVIEALSLAQHGLDLDVDVPEVFIPHPHGGGIRLSQNVEAAAPEIGRFSQRDAERYKDYREFIESARQAVASLLNDIPPDVFNLGTGDLMSLASQGLAFRRLGTKRMMDLLRVPPMCVADWLNEWFETDCLKGALAGWATQGMWSGPWSPGSAANLLLAEITSQRAVKGGPAALVAALARCANHFGVEVRTGSKVSRISIERGAARGVVLSDGEEIAAGVVASSADPKSTLLGLVEPHLLPHKLQSQVEKYRARGTTAAVRLALDRAPEWKDRRDESFEHVRTGDDLDTVERAFDPVKYRGFAERPALDIYVPTISNRSLAPAGHHVVSVLAHFAAHNLDGGWTDDAREKLGDNVVSELARYAPGVEKSIVGREVLTPADIEARYGTAGGHIHHGEHALDQLIARPNHLCARYATPVAGLFLCGAGSHPGGGVSCAPGYLAAKAMLSRR